MTKTRLAAAVTLAATVALTGMAAEDALVRRARTGDAESQLRLADEFMFGRNGRPVSPPLAVYWFRQAAQGGSPVGQYNLAMCYLQGWGGEKRPAAAFRYFGKAMDGGVDQAALRYAEQLHDGVPAASDPEGDFPEVKPDPEGALAVLRRIAPRDREAQLLLARYLFRHADRHVDELLPLLERHAAGPDPDPEMLILYAACLRSGIGGGGDSQLAVRVLERAAAAGNPEAMAQLAEMLHGGFGVKVDHARGDELLDRALALGSSRAMVARGVEYLTGLRRPHDPVRAFELFRQAAQKEYPPAWRQLGLCYASGIGTPRSEDQAFQCFFHAARAGDAPAQFQVGECFRYGRGTEADFTAAFYWYARGAAGGNSDAMRETGEALLAGRGTAPDREQAMQWLERAARAGDRSAAAALGLSDAEPF